MEEAREDSVSVNFATYGSVPVAVAMLLRPWSAALPLFLRCDLVTTPLRRHACFHHGYGQRCCQPVSTDPSRFVNMLVSPDATGEKYMVMQLANACRWPTHLPLHALV